ncbi:hypothetical protein CRUP_008585, partial [Coryphaenoides rupestris]
MCRDAALLCVRDFVHTQRNVSLWRTTSGPSRGLTCRRPSARCANPRPPRARTPSCTWRWTENTHT